ncbi:uncharacterized protein LOC128755771 isoform X2 [Synchiropus splendidus]|uniref:uncharacterized protein LOC128755771 isoform X2 n=1 Tax=Synchiropus splendidus TaxID=270530 RepID=UPI00237DCE91|nr:uncharacterized protein LOC128755771 isoform X2 [Synchiropus splendidus]
MGNCCRPASPCGSAEETSVLLKDDSKGQVTAGGSVAVGTCGPAGDEKIIAVDVMKEALKTEEKFDSSQPKPSPKKSAETSATQENGRLQKEEVRTEAASPALEPSLEIRASRAQEDGEKAAGDGPKDLLLCSSPDADELAAAWEVLSSNAEGISASEPNFSEVTSVSDGHKSSSQGESFVTSDPGREANKEPCSDAAQLPESSEDSVPNITAVLIQEVKSSNVSAVASERDEASACVEASLQSRGISSVPELPASDTSEVSDEGRDSSGVAEELVTSAPADTERSPEHTQDDKAAPACSRGGAQVATSSDEARQDVPEETMWEGLDNDGEGPKALKAEWTEGEEEKVGLQTEEVAGDVQGVQDETTEEVCLENSEEDLYRGADELSTTNSSGPSSLLDSSAPKLESRCSLAPAVDILWYSEQEWRGNTAKSALIRKGYRLMSHSFSRLRRVRGDNYCALRATLFQALSHSTQLPSWLQDDITLVPEELEEREGLVSQWIFPGECLQEDGMREVIPQLKGYMKLLQDKWRAAVDCSSPVERQRLCESVFQGGEDELGLLEALKLLMLSRAVELHACMRGGGDVPLFCWLLFARDSSDCPRSFLSNHLSHVGLSAGLEQVEMFLLGYTLQLTLQVHRLYKVDTEEFVTFYPDDHKDDWPLLSLVTEDDRHYNVPLLRAAEEEEPSRS